MSQRQVRFATPVSSEAGDLFSPDAGNIWTSVFYNSNPTQCHGSVSTDSPVEARPALQEDPIDWWGTYVPLESSPYKPLSGMTNISLAVYKLRSKLPHCNEYRSDASGKKEKNYEMCFNGDFDEVTRMLSDMYVVELLRTPNFLTARHSKLGDINVSPPSQTSEKGYARPEELPAQLSTLHEDVQSTPLKYQPYDCGWDDSISNGSVPPEVSSPTDPYNCGWEDAIQATSPEAVIQSQEKSTDTISEEEHLVETLHPTSDEIVEPTIQMDDPYNCRWDDPVIKEVAALNESWTQNPYDCRWGDIVDATALQATEEKDKILDIYNAADSPCSERIGPVFPTNDPYDARWDDPMDDCKGAQTASTADSYDCIWDDTTAPEEDIMLEGSTDNPYNCGWDLSMDARAHSPEMMEGDAANNSDHGRADGMVHSDPGRDSTDDLYDLGWEDPMEEAKIRRQSIEQMMSKEMDVIDLTMSEGTEVIDLTLSPANLVAERSVSIPGPNTFEEVGESMRHAMRWLNSIGHSDFDRFVCSIVAPETRLVSDPRPATTFMANRHLFGAYMEARDRVTDLGADIINIH
ncbi:uncharacterized protein F5147DRAFT_781843 [Suillus discolor]|uniref:Uncharacterized protein n=1 Tax=Suillus discolor TaxID=1912936 RepID=A0A9P7ES25_9AGAM|nr:uncharacterized protein F5147DRAFT_781843 [Suillus discolor]KAG2085884.1 hypothetical protein F5147DRAFT_781843 [Suillus discolor]